MDRVPLDFVILDVEVLHKTDLSTCLRKEEVLADVIKHGPLSQLHDIREAIPSLIPKDGFEVVDVDSVGGQRHGCCHGRARDIP